MPRDLGRIAQLYDRLRPLSRVEPTEEGSNVRRHGKWIDLNDDLPPPVGIGRAREPRPLRRGTRIPRQDAPYLLVRARPFQLRHKPEHGSTDVIAGIGPRTLEAMGQLRGNHRDVRALPEAVKKRALDRAAVFLNRPPYPHAVFDSLSPWTVRRGPARWRGVDDTVPIGKGGIPKKILIGAGPHAMKLDDVWLRKLGEVSTDTADPRNGRAGQASKVDHIRVLPPADGAEVRIGQRRSRNVVLPGQGIHFIRIRFEPRGAPPDLAPIWPDSGCDGR